MGHFPDIYKLAESSKSHPKNPFWCFFLKNILPNGAIACCLLRQEIYIFGGDVY
jgi:hypothetical protein